MAFFSIKDFATDLAVKIRSIVIGDENLPVHVIQDSAGSEIDFATETTLAALLAKVIAAPSTAAKQDAASALLTTLTGKDYATQTTLAAVLAKISSDPATQSTLLAILAKLIAAPATEAKQDTGNTSLSTIAGKDFSTQTTLAAVLAKLSSDPSTGGKQDTGNASLATISGKDFATQTTLAAVLAKLITAPATEAKQDAIITALGSITIDTTGLATQTTLAAVLAKIIAAPATEAKQDTLIAKDFATQTTLAAVLAKIIAAPATEAKQDTGNTSLSTIAGKDFATQTTLASVLSKISSDPATQTTLASILTALGSPMQSSGGSVTANAGTNLNTSTLALESGNLAALVALQAGITPVVTAAVATTKVLKASAGSLVRASATNTSLVEGWFIILDAASAPTDGAVAPIAVEKLPPGETAVIEAGFPPLLCATGITAVLTSAADPFTKTTTDGLQGFISGQVR